MQGQPLTALLVAGALLAACNGHSGEVGAKGSGVSQLRAVVNEILSASQVAPGESLRVRLSGTVGPNGAYSLGEVRVTRERQRIVIEPLVNRQEDGNFIQMLIPLEHTLALALPAGRYTLEVRGEGTARTKDVVVGASAKRAAPETRAELMRNDGGRVVSLVGDSPDGFVERVEFRLLAGTAEGGGAADREADANATWSPATVVERSGGTLRCLVQVPAAAGQRLEARAVDGQGVVDPSPALVELP